MATPSSTLEKSPNRRSKATATAGSSSQVRAIRLERGLTQAELAQRSGLHRNSIGKLERGTTKEVTEENARALASALKTSVARLGLRVKPAVEARSVRFRRLTIEQRQIVDELLALPPDSFVLLREAIEIVRARRMKGRSRGAAK